jgi:hypothetical protein
MAARGAVGGRGGGRADGDEVSVAIRTPGAPARCVAPRPPRAGAAGGLPAFPVPAAPLRAAHPPTI